MRVHLSLPAHVQRHKRECKHNRINMHIGITTWEQVFQLFPVSQHKTPGSGYLTPKVRPAHHRGAGTGCQGNFLLVIKKLRIWG